jgi:hypothetical protein
MAGQLGRTAEIRGDPVSDIAPFRLLVRCLVERKGDQWQAFSLEFGLAVQGDSMVEVRRKLESMIESYVHDALVGEDREHAYDLLACRKATWRVFLRYYSVWALTQIAHVIKFMAAPKDGMIYHESLPLQPQHHPA